MPLLPALLMLPFLTHAEFSGSDDRVVRNAVCVHDGVLYVGGDFSHFGGKERDGVAALDLATGEVLDWEPEIGDGHVSAILEKDGLIYLGGCRDHQKDKPCKGLLMAVENARQGSGATVKGWDPAPDKPVAALERGPGGSLYVGGKFENVAGAARRNLAQITDATQGPARALSFNPAPDERVTSLVFEGGRLFAGGFFPGLLAAWDAAGGTPISLPINIEGTRSREILRMIAFQGRLYAVGVEITTVNGQPRSNAFAIGLPDLQLLPWHADLDAGAGALTAWGSTIYVGGDFLSLNGEACRLAALDSQTGARLPLDFKPEHNTYALQAFEGGFFASGYWKGYSALLGRAPGRPSQIPSLLSFLGRP